MTSPDRPHPAAPARLLRAQHRLAEVWESSYTRVGLAVFLIVAGYALLLAYFVQSYTERLYEVRMEELRRIVELGLAALDPLRESADDSLLSQDQYRREGAIIIRDLTHRYRLGENYLFMATESGLVLVHPYQPGLEFTNQWNATDEDGKRVMQEMIAIATSEGGAGLIEYRYPPPNSSTPQRKIAYIVSIPEWDAFIGAGMYMDAIDAEMARYVRNSMLMTMGLVVLIFVVVFLTLNPTLSSYRHLLNLFEQVRHNPDRIPAVPLDRYREGSEAWNLLAGFHSMLEQIEHSKHARQEAALAERNRLARELHDAVSQTLFSANIIADVLPRLYERDPEVGRERLDELRELTRGALAEMRSLLIELRPSALEQTSLDDLLHQLADAVIARARLPVTVVIEGRCALPPDVKIALYRITQEALNNVVKHARAGEAGITLRYTERGVELSITDDGRGFDPAGVPPNRLGLSIMRERAESVGATLAIESQPGAGTTIRVEWSEKSAHLL